MGIIGRYLDSLDDEARDRVIQAQEWCRYDVGHPGGPRCLYGHAHGGDNWTAVDEAVNRADIRRVVRKFDRLHSSASPFRTDSLREEVRASMLSGDHPLIRRVKLRAANPKNQARPLSEPSVQNAAEPVTP